MTTPRLRLRRVRFSTSLNSDTSLYLLLASITLRLPRQVHENKIRPLGHIHSVHTRWLLLLHRRPRLGRMCFHSPLLDTLSGTSRLPLRAYLETVLHCRQPFSPLSSCVLL